MSSKCNKDFSKGKIAYLSNAALITPVIRVFVRKMDWQDRLQSTNQLNVDDYIDANNRVFGIVFKRSYGEK